MPGGPAPWQWWPRMHAVRGFCVDERDRPAELRQASCRHPPGGRPLAGTVTQGGHISTEPRINERIRVPEVRLVGPAGEQVGIVAINDALALAQEADLDLVEVAPTARPPVCKLMDYGKFKYESALKARESRKNQTQTVIKEIKLRPKIDPHDYGTKKGHVERFLKQGDKVKVTIMFRGREQSRPELGYRLLQRLAEDVQELGFVEAQPKLDGRNMIMVIGPHKRKADQKTERSPARASARAAAQQSTDAQEAEAAQQSADFLESVAAQQSAPREAAPAQQSAPAQPSAAPRSSGPAQPSAVPRPAQPSTGAREVAAARPGAGSRESAAPQRSAAPPRSAGPRDVAAARPSAAPRDAAAGREGSGGQAGEAVPAAPPVPAAPRPVPTPRAPRAPRVTAAAERGPAKG
jgi:translation initiation factor IF-3